MVLQTEIQVTMTHNKFFIIIAILAITIGASPSLIAQCGTFADSKDGKAAKEAHVVYRAAIKDNRLDEAFPMWQKAFELAPAADGNRTTQYTDGVILYKDMLAKETDDTKKSEDIAEIKKLYDQAGECYPKEKGYLMGRKAYDLLYTINADRREVYDAAKVCMDLTGNDMEYVVFYPLTEGIIALFKDNKLDKSIAREDYKQMISILDFNINKGGDLKSYYEKAKEDVTAQFEGIEDYIFDCDYFKAKLLPEYKANPNDYDLIRDVYQKLADQGCTNEDPDMAEMKQKYEAYAAQENSRRMAEYQAGQPAYAANQAYKEGNYAEAISKYKEALAAETDNEKKAKFLYSMAVIEGRKMNKYSSARSHALEAAKLRSGWGDPYMLIGDLYATTARSCGKEVFDAQMAILAAVDKWNYAAKIDPSVSSSAQRKVARYRNQLPEKSEAFMRGYTNGQPIKVNCWIGETVSLRTK